MNTKSQHLCIDLWLGSYMELTKDKLCEFVKQNFTVVNNVNHKFSPFGETIVFVLSESHFSIHTYPEHNYLSIDLYICNEEIDMKEVLSKILKISKPIKYNSILINRGDQEGIKFNE